jgi:pyruvate dehydrogenase E2 component (dihydrolipoamide acetyltransferase)
MIKKVTLPKLGQTVESATIERWVKAEGDPVKKGEVICEITTDKATLEVESFHRGMLLKVLAPEGVELSVGDLIAVVGDEGEAVPDELVAEAKAQQGGAAEAPAATPAKAAAEAKGETSPRPAEKPAPAKTPERKPPAKTGAGKASDVKIMTLPKLGQTVESAKIERWVKAEGDPVKKGEVICEITTDKATLEVESFYRGTLLKVLAPEGDEELEVGAPIAAIGPEGAEVPEDLLSGAAPAAPAEEEAEAPAEAAPESSEAAAATPAAPAAAVRHEGGRIFASPRARMRARERGVELASLAGTGPNGRIVEADVLAAAEAGPALAAKATPVALRLAEARGVDLATVEGTGVGGKIKKEDVLRAAEAAPAAPAAAPAAAPGQVVPLTPMRRIVAERMSLSKQTIPCYYLDVDADVTDMVALRNRLNNRADRKSGAKISFNDFIIRACGRALAAFPPVNSRWVEGGIERRSDVNVGFAVALDEGLIVPVVRGADAKPLRELSREVADLADRARSKKLLPEEYQDGCMTVTNLGMFGIKRFTAVVNPGESTILALGAIEDRVVYRQGGIQVRKMMTLTLSVDHRLVDGAVGAQFLAAIRDALEAPQTLVD